MNGPAFSAWAAAGFGCELLPLCPSNHGCDSPGKIPHLAGWRKLEITPALVTSWSRWHRGNVGLRTRLFPAIDLDIEDAEIADACERVALVTLGSTARRTRANTSRRLLLCRREGAPFPKVAIPFTAPGGESGKVEVLADGQQCVVAGVHHTGATIEWRAGQPTAADLAPLTVEQRDALAAALRTQLNDLGCVVKESPAIERSAPRAAPRRSERDAEIAGQALRRLDPDLPYDTWITIGMALHSRWPDDDGLALWNAWSSRGEKYPGTRVLERHWRSFASDRGVGFGSLIALARRTG